MKEIYTNRFILLIVHWCNCLSVVLLYIRQIRTNDFELLASQSARGSALSRASLPEIIHVLFLSDCYIYTFLLNKLNV